MASKRKQRRLQRKANKLKREIKFRTKQAQKKGFTTASISELNTSRISLKQITSLKQQLKTIRNVSRETLIPQQANSFADDIRKTIERQRQEFDKRMEQQRKSKPSEAVDFSRIAIKQFRFYINGFPNAISNRVNEVLDRLLQDYGYEAVEIALESTPSLSDFLVKMAYPSDQAVEEFCSQLINNIPDITIDERKDLITLFDIEEEIFIEYT